MEKFTDNFGSLGEHLIDFYHVSEYLAAAGRKIAGAKKSVSWLREQKARVLLGQAKKVLRTLEAHRESQNAPEKPVEDAHQCTHQRLQCLHCAKA